MSNFSKELEELINKHCMENSSNTPDFILAQYLRGCLVAFGVAQRARDRWYGLNTDAVPAVLERDDGEQDSVRG